MIDWNYNHSIQFSFSNNDSDKDLTTFLKVLEKCNNEAKKSGFRSIFNSEEKKFITYLYEGLTNIKNSLYG